MTDRIPVFYSPFMVAASGGFSPSAAKPQPVTEAWLDRGDILIKHFEPCTERQIALAHDHDFVSAVLKCERDNGHGNRLSSVAATLPYTCGSMLAAAAEALTNGKGAVSPSSGFHHAGYDFAGGYCTFNGLMVAAMNLLPGFAAGIMDCDNHWGNGTDQIIRHLNVGDQITHYSHGGEPDVDGETFLRKLPRIMERFEFNDVLLYQAGADPHIDDPLGGFLTTEQLYERDRIVFLMCKRMNLPVAWNLAGGYQADFSKVIEIHNNTMKAFAESIFS